jgi:hypothetical protein
LRAPIRRKMAFTFEKNANTSGQRALEPGPKVRTGPLPTENCSHGLLTNGRRIGPTIDQSFVKSSRVLYS